MSAADQRGETAGVLDGGPPLEGLIRRDQLEAVRQGVTSAIPVNALLGLCSAVVAINAGRASVGLTWFAVSTIINLLRICLCRAPCAGLSLSSETTPERAGAAARSIDRHLRLTWSLGLISGIVWVFLPILCGGYASPHTLFYLTVTCGITAGAATYGTSFARVSACFMTPPLLSAAACLCQAGGFDRDVLAAIVLLYLFALLRSVVATEKSFRETSRLKNEARAWARSRETAHASAKALAETMLHRATHDDLTGLLNRAGFVKKVEERILEKVGPHCLMLLDLDGFKIVNDVYGHSMGDRVLVEVARRLRERLSHHCLCARLGGDEFAVFYDPSQDGEAPTELAAALIRAVAKPFETFDAGRLGVSIGLYQAAEISLTHMLTCADEALYSAKEAGRNRFRVFDEGLRNRLDMRRDSERDLSQALADKSLEVWFQPIFGRDGRAVAGLEALVRWPHPVHGWIPPPDLIAAAAIAGLTEPLLRFIVERVCAMMRTLCDEGRSDVRVAMNVSPREMAQFAVAEIILARLRALGLPPTMLEIEITEETVLDIEAVQAKLLALSNAGIGVALDDFGTGYASLASLRDLRAGRIKIDRSLVTGLTASDDKKALVEAVLGLGRSLDLEVVAEGVETADDLSTLQALGCPFMQGYYLGRPAPSHATLQVIRAAALIDA